MYTLLPENNNKNKAIKIIHSRDTSSSKEFARIDQLLLILPKKISPVLWRKVPQGKKIKNLMLRRAKGAVPAAEVRLNNKRQTRVLVGKVSPNSDTFAELTLGRKLVSAATTEKSNCIGIWVLGFDSRDQTRIAKNIVAAGLAERCEVQVSYAIGIAEPTSIAVDTFGTGKLDNNRLVTLVREHFDLRPRGIIEMLDLLRPIYTETAAYGHFGREDVGLPWEKTDRADALCDAVH